MPDLGAAGQADHGSATLHGGTVSRPCAQSSVCL
jgi:hypothetical protein